MSKQKRTREHLMNFGIAGFSYYEGAIAFSDLKIGAELQLVIEPDNKYNNNAMETRRLKTYYNQ